ncbi:MAG: hypothetical protein H0U16_13170, partial [Actinobacteria bacterium]|nr:hypothetical protein [Actinomycetota bacterium]
MNPYPGQRMELITGIMERWVSDYGYLATFLLMVAESACIPFPSEVTMVVAGLYA